MGRVHARMEQRRLANGTDSGYGAYGMRRGILGGFGGLALIPLLGLGVVAAIVFKMWRRRRMLRLGGLRGGIATGGIAATGIAATNCASTCATVGLNEKLVAAERLPGVKYREVDVITRKRVS